MTDKTGGSAFPAQPIHKYENEKWVIVEQEGMTLRDYFAAKAMQGAIADGGLSCDSELNGRLAVVCYEMADAMIKARGNV